MSPRELKCNHLQGPGKEARGGSVHSANLGVKTVCTCTHMAHTCQLSRRGYKEIGGLLLRPPGRGHGGWEPHSALSLILIVALCACITSSNRFYQAGERTGGKLGCSLWRSQGAQCPSGLASTGFTPKCTPCQGLWETQFDPRDSAWLLGAWEHGLSPAARHSPGSLPQTCGPPLHFSKTPGGQV